MTVFGIVKVYHMAMPAFYIAMHGIVNFIMCSCCCYDHDDQAFEKANIYFNVVDWRRQANTSDIDVG